MKNQQELISKLHTAARHYCDDRINSLEAFKREPGGVYTTQHSNHEDVMDAMPRMAFLNGVLWDIEAVIPESHSTIDEIIDLFVKTADKSEKFYLGSSNDKSIIEILRQERNAFVEYIQKISVDQLQKVEDLPYRRTLSDNQHLNLLKRLNETWGVQIDGGWFSGEYYPFVDNSHIPPDKFPQLLAFWADAVLDIKLEKTIKDALIVAQTKHIYIFEQNYPGIECDISLLNLERARHNIIGIAFPGDLSWIIFSSNQRAMIFGGEWLLKGVKEFWSEWQKHVYETYDPLE